MDKAAYVYMMANKSNAVIYTDVTRDLIKRAYEHKNKIVEGVTSKYNVNKLVYYEVFDSMMAAITREKQLKAGPRQKKVDLIRSKNFSFEDLYEKILP